MRFERAWVGVIDEYIVNQWTSEWIIEMCVSWILPNGLRVLSLHAQVGNIDNNNIDNNNIANNCS